MADNFLHYADQEDFSAEFRQLAQPAAAYLRKPSSVLNLESQWERLPLQNGKVQRKCIHCGLIRTSTQPQTTQLAVHLVRCHKCPHEVKIHMLQTYSAKAVQDAGEKMCLLKSDRKPEIPSSIIIPAADKTSAKKRKAGEGVAAAKSPGPLYQYADRCDDDRTKSLRKAITKFVVANGISFNIIDSPYFKDMIKVANAAAPQFIPSVKTFLQTDLPNLHEELKTELNKRMAAHEEPFLILGIDGFQNETGMHVYILTLAKADTVMFVDCVAETAHNGDELFRVIDSILIRTADGEPVETVFAGVVFDTTKINPSAGHKLQVKYPKLFNSGCRTHAGGLLMEDLAKVEPIKEIVNNALSIAKFVQVHPEVKLAYKRLMQEFHGATMQKTFPETGFAYCHDALEHMKGQGAINVSVMRAMVEENSWLETTQGISQALVQEFEETVKSNEFLDSVNAVMRLTQVISVFIRHLERHGAHASWVLPIFEALKKDLHQWANDVETINQIGRTHARQVVELFNYRYFGEGILEPIYHRELMLAMILDPFITPKTPVLKSMNENWEEHCQEIFKQFFRMDGESKILQAENELLRLTQQVDDGIGSFGKDAQRFQDVIQNSTANKVENSKSEVAVAVAEQLTMIEQNFSPVVYWRGRYSSDFPALAEIATRLLPLAIQTADVERCCKVSRLAHSKSSDGLENKNVVMLIACYVNMHLLKQLTAAKGHWADGTGAQEGLLADDIIAELDGFDVDDDEDKP